MTSEALDNANPFSRSALWLVIGIAVASLVAAIVLTVVSDDPSASTTSVTSDAYSRSAIGHKGLVELLGQLDVPVIVTPLDTADKAKHGLLVIAEPSDRSLTELREHIAGANRVLVVLPKWYGIAKAGHAWIDAAYMVTPSEPDEVLKMLGSELRVARGQPPAAWTSDGKLASPTIEFAQYLDARGQNDMRIDVYDGDRALVAHQLIDATEVWVLADPDVINNAGLRHPENARFAVALIDQLRDDGPVVIDESIHGLRRAATPTLSGALFQFPVVLATLQIACCALLAIWAAAVRFGPRRAAPPPIAPGKDFLIRNTAGLLGFGRHHVEALRRYLAVNIAAVTTALHAPENLSPAATTEWLERIRMMRAVPISFPGLQADVAAGGSAQRVLELADQIYRWRSEMIHGPRKHS